MKSIQHELPLDFTDYKSPEWMLKHPQCLTISIKHLYDRQTIPPTGDRPIQGNAPNRATC